MEWLAALQRLRERNAPAVIVTLATVRGHAPREPGAKLVVSADAQWGTIGGGNVEATAIDRAREILADPGAGAELMSFALNERVSTAHGVQCCGGEVTVLLEPVRPSRTIAIFGLGHVGYEIAHILRRHSVELVLVDSREDAMATERIDALRGGAASVTAHHTPAPEKLIEQLPPGSTVLILTHDHAEDLVLCDAALRVESLAYIGVIGSRTKALRFQKKLRELGHADDAIERITCPIGLAEITSKVPASIAVGVVADLLERELVVG